MVEMDGDEMTRIIWAFIKEKVMGSCPRNGRVCHKQSWGVAGGTGDLSAGVGGGTGDPCAASLSPPAPVPLSAGSRLQNRHNYQEDLPVRRSRAAGAISGLFKAGG